MYDQCQAMQHGHPLISSPFVPHYGSNPHAMLLVKHPPLQWPGMQIYSDQEIVSATAGGGTRACIGLSPLTQEGICRLRLQALPVPHHPLPALLRPCCPL
ncbi:hypothetical protein KIL84_023074 [Mauremys mutica]|uniref:Uncharacterized protein n=1 Tax=Mauremys mutica TaxID=74926 RepID=A0A9D3WR10_9SAUR|nr:hypothetical protein KIL84_023074 [Mauremys mutica]